MSGLRSDIAECEHLLRSGAEEIKADLEKMVEQAIGGRCDFAVEIFTKCKLTGCAFISEIQRLKGLQGVLRSHGTDEPVKAEHLELWQTAQPLPTASEVWNGSLIVPRDRKMAAAGDHTLDDDERRDG